MQVTKQPKHFLHACAHLISKQLTGCDNTLISTMKWKPKIRKSSPRITTTTPRRSQFCTSLPIWSCTGCDSCVPTRCPAPRRGCPSRRQSRGRWRRRYRSHRWWRAACRPRQAAWALHCLRRRPRGGQDSHRNTRARGAPAPAITKVTKDMVSAVFHK